MMKKIVKKISTCLGVIVLGISLQQAVFADDDPGTTVFQFLKMDISARVVAMGGAFTAVADDVNAIRYNPAGMRMLLKPQITGTHMIWFSDLRAEYVAYGTPLKNGTAIGLSMFYFTAAEDIEGRDDFGNKTGALPFEQGVTSIAWAMSFDRSDNFIIGLGAKYAYETLDSVQDSAVAFDAGMLGKLYKKMLFGISIRNIALDDSPLPVESRIGLSYLFNSAGLNIDAYKFTDTDVRYALGCEYFVSDYVIFRGGYNSSLTSLGELNEDDSFYSLSTVLVSGISLGAGFITKPVSFLKGAKLHFDYAITNYGRLGFTHLFSFSTEF